MSTAKDDAGSPGGREPGGPLTDDQLRFFFDSSPLLMGAVELLDDGDLRHLYDNVTANRFFGLEAGGTTGRTARQMGVPDATIRLWRDNYEASSRRGQPVHFDYVHEPWAGGARVLAVTVARLPGGGRNRFSYVAQDVTETRRAEADLKRQETRLELALDAARLGDWSWDAGSNLVTFSPRAAAVFGVSPGAHMTWEEVVDLIPEDDRPVALGARDAAMSGDTYDIEYRLRRPSDGRLVWIGVRGRAVVDEDGRVVARLGMASDQTRLKEIEAQLREALESTTDSIFVLSPDWRFTFLNGQAIEQIAQGRDLVGQVIWEAFPEAVGGELWTAYQRCMGARVQTEADQFYEPLNRHFKARAFPTEAGGITVFFRDITDELAAQAKLAEAQGALQAMGEATPDLLYAKDRRGRMIYCNPATLEVTGRSLEAVLGRTELEWMRDPEEARRIVETDQAIMAEGRSRVVEEVATDERLGEPRIWQSTKTPLRDPRTGEVSGIVGISRDITDQRRAKAVLEEQVAAAVAAARTAQTQLAQAEKLTALGQLAGGIAHDVNNVMQGVLSAASLIERRASDPEAVTRLAAMIGEAAHRGGSLTRRLLAISRQSELRAEPVDPAALMSSLQEVLAHTLGAGVAIDLRLDEDLPVLAADRAQLEAALINLATNARDAMPGGGRLVLAVSRTHIAQGAEEDLAAGDYVCFSVEDTGTGIDPAILPRVLEPFFTTKPQDKGTGLGLSMARSFAQQSGGALRLESELGRGTRVRILLPADAVAPLPGPRDDTRQTAAAGHILLVDDEYLVRQMLAEQLRAAGFTVTEVEDGALALALIRGGEVFDVLVTDRSMPGLDGEALIREARALRAQTPAILLTGFAGGAETVEDPSIVLLQKPIDAATLVAHIGKLLN